MPSPFQSIDIVLTPINMTSPADYPPEDPDPSPSKLWQNPITGTWTITDVTGLRLGARWRYDNTGYDIISIGNHRVSVGEEVVVTDKKMEGYLPIPAKPLARSRKYSLPEVLLRFSKGEEEGNREVVLHALGATATFGKDFSTAIASEIGSGWGLESGNHLLHRVGGSGCNTRDFVAIKSGNIAVIDRGICTFMSKLLNAKEAGARGVIVLGNSPKPGLTDQQVFDESGMIRPAADAEDKDTLGRVEGIGMIYVDHVAGDVIRRLMDEGLGLSVEMMRLEGGLHGEQVDVKGDAASRGGRERRVREGRLGLGEWEISNLRIVEGGS
jgi:mannosidase alpha-like ER degradation enhancer 1